MDSALGVVGLADGDPLPSGLRRIFAGIGLVDLDSDPSAVAPFVRGVRIFAGYAGWSPGQLEQEVAHGNWYVVGREARDPFGPTAVALWRDVLARQPGPLSLVASYPRDPSLN